MQRSISAFVLACSLVACGRSDKESSPNATSTTNTANTTSDAGVAAVSGQLPGYRLELAIYTSNKLAAKAGVIDALKKHVRAEGWVASVEVKTTADYSLPEDSYITNHVGATGVVAAKSKTTAVVITLTSPAGNTASKFKAAHAAVAKAAVSLDGFVWDQTRWHLYRPERWASAHERWTGDSPFVQEHISLQMQRDQHGARIVSVGLSKFGLPELVMKGVSPGQRGWIVALMNLAGQALVEGRRVPTGALTVDVAAMTNQAAQDYFSKEREKGAHGKIRLVLTRAKRSEHDPNTELLQIAFQPTGTSPGAQEASAIAHFFGRNSPKVGKADTSSVAWKAASAKAIKRLMQLKPRVVAGRRRCMSRPCLADGPRASNGCGLRCFRGRERNCVAGWQMSRRS